jgi:hypothetical protein
MDHGNMGHGGMDHGGMDHGNMCNMNVSLSSTAPSYPASSSPKDIHSSRKLIIRTKQMLFTWDTQNLCIVFKSWRVTSTMSLLWSLLGVMLLTAGYELIREISRRYEAKVQREIDDMPSKFLLLPYFLPTPNFLLYTLCFVARDWRINIAKMGIFVTVTKTTKKKAHCSHQDARLPTRMQRPKPSRLLYTPFKSFIPFSSCKSSLPFYF